MNPSRQLMNFPPKQRAKHLLFYLIKVKATPLIRKSLF